MLKKLMLNLMLVIPICVQSSSVTNSVSYLTDIKNLHDQINHIDSKLKKGDIAQKKAEAEKSPLWHKMAIDYNNLASIYYYNSKSSVGIATSNNFANAVIAIPNASDIYLSSQDIALMKTALQNNNVLDIRVFFNQGIITYTVVEIATNLTVTSGAVVTKLKTAPATTWSFILMLEGGKQMSTAPQTFNNSIYLQM